MPGGLAPILAAMDTTCATTTTVFLVEDFAPIRERLTSLLGTLDGVEVVGAAVGARAATTDILRARPHAVLLDLHLAEGNGLDVLRAVHPQAPDIVFIVLTNFANAQYRKACVAAGASHVVDKSAETSEVLRLVAGLAAHRVSLSSFLH